MVIFTLKLINIMLTPKSNNHTKIVAYKSKIPSPTLTDFT